MQLLPAIFIVFFIAYSIPQVNSNDTTTTTPPNSEPNPIQPVYSRVKQSTGFTTVLKCIIYDKKATNITWTRKGTQVKGDQRHTVVKSSNSTTRSTSLKIKSIESSDYGNYECNANISGKLQSATVKLLQRKHENPVRGDPTKLHHPLHSNASLRCFLPKQAKSIAWLKNGTEIKSDEHHDVVRSSTDKFRTTTLHIYSIKKSDFGTYECTANVSGKIESANISLAEKKKEPVLKAAHQKYTELLKSNVTLKCHLSETPTSFTFTKNGTAVQFNNSHKLAKFGTKKGKITAIGLMIEHLKSDDYGDYECEAVVNGKTHSAKIKLIEKKNAD